MKIGKYNLKIRQQLLTLFLLFAITPAVIITGITFVTNANTISSATNDIEGVQMDALTGLSFLYAENINNWFSNEGNIVSSLANDPTIRTAIESPYINSTFSKSEVNTLFSTWIDSSDSINEFVLANYTTGQIILSKAENNYTNTSTTVISDTSFLGAKSNQGKDIQSDNLFLDELKYQSNLDQYSFVFSIVIRPLSFDNAKPSGVLIEKLNPVSLWDVIAPRDSNGKPMDTFYNEIGLGNSGEIVLINENGIAMSPSRFTLSNKQFVLVNDYSKVRGFTNAVQNGVYIGLQEDYRGTKVFGSYVFLGPKTQSADNRESEIVNRLTFNLPWVISVKIDQSEVLIPVNSIQNNMNFSLELILTLTAIIGLIVVLISLYVSNSFSKPLSKLAETSQLLSSGDLTVSVAETQKADEIGDLENAFFTMIGFLKPSVNSISDIAKALAASAQELASSSEEVNASSEEMSSVSQQISKGAQQQSEYLNSSMKQMEHIQGEFSSKLGNIKIASEVIENISNQVNMLALNASIEAARAGEYGRGFAVVADNIRRLADDTKSSVGQVNNIIEDLIGSISNNMSVLNQSLVNITSVSEETASGAEEASAATEEQAATMEELSASAQELARVAIDLEVIVKKFTIN